MKSTPMVSVTVTTGLFDAIAAAGGDPDETLRALGLKRSAFSNPDRFIANATFARLLEEAGRATGDQCFGLHFGENFDVRDIGTLAYVVLNSPTIADAIRNLERYHHIHNDGAVVSFDVDARAAYLRFIAREHPIEPRRQRQEFAMTVMVKVFRLLGEVDWTPKEIQFAHEAPPDTSEHLRVFGCRLSFGCAANAVVVERDFVERLVPAADPKLFRILRQHAEHILNDLPRETDFLADVRRAIADAIRDGDPRLARVAAKLAMSPRSLQRHLEEEGAVFKALVDDTRLRFALGYLRDRGHTLTEIAFLLGYSEVSALNRAFKRWTGVTPLGYRVGELSGTRSRMATATKENT